MLAGSLVLVGILSALPMLPSTPSGQVPQPGSTPAIVTASPSTLPGTGSTAAGGGDLGRPVAFETARGAGTLTVHSAVWTDSGEFPPMAGERYLVLEVSVSATAGELPIDALLFLAEGAAGPVLPGFGPELDQPLGGRLLAAGEQARGQLGFSLPAGAVTLHLLDEQLLAVASIAVPGP